jgi:hypothetical protein
MSFKMRTRETFCTMFGLSCLIYTAMLAALGVIERCSICKPNYNMEEIHSLPFPVRNGHSPSPYNKKKSYNGEPKTNEGRVFLDNIAGLHEDIRGSSLAKTTVVSSPARKGERKNAPRLLYFAITCHKGLQKAKASEDSWGRHVNRGKGILWYTSQYEPLLRWQHVLPNRGGYWNITYRVLAVYKHVFRHHRGYDWYALFWDDNYVFVENFEVKIVSDLLRGVT